MSLFDLTNKKIFITGAGGYLGQEIAKALLDHNASLILNVRDKKKLESFYQANEKYKEKIEVVEFDLQNTSSIDHFFDNYSGDIDGVINNAYMGKSGTIETTNLDDFDLSLQMNLKIPFYIMKKSLPFLKKTRGKVINVASMYGIVTPDLNIYDSPEASNPPQYGASKAGLIHLTRYAANEFAKYGITVNAVSPGAFPSKDVQESNPSFISSLEEKIPLGRIGNPNDLQGIFVYLCSDASSYMTGENVVIDGGWIIR